MSLNVFAKPKKMANEEWLNTIADTICEVYHLDDCLFCCKGAEGKAVKVSLYNAVKSDGTVSYKKFVEELTKYKDEETDDANFGQHVASIICPVMLKKNNWTTFFDDPEGKALESLSTRALRNALKNAFDVDFCSFVCLLWVKINIPELLQF